MPTDEISEKAFQNVNGSNTPVASEETHEDREGETNCRERCASSGSSREAEQPGLLLSGPSVKNDCSTDSYK